jgi:hypothetical protein
MSSTLYTEHLLKMQWYYSVEIAPGVVTTGQDHPGGALTREALRRVRFSGRKCVDIGVQEGLFPVLLYRGGAGAVEAQNRFPRLQQVEALRRIYKTQFRFEYGQSLDEYAWSRRTRGEPLADVVLFAGVLYHMFDPFAGLCRVRGMVAKGGV